MSRSFFIVVCLTAAVNTGMGLIIPLLPNFLREYGFTVAGLSLPFVSLIIGRMISKSFAASIIRVLKNKVTLVLSFILYALIFLCYSFAESAWMFIFLRFFEGVVEGISIVCLTDLAITLSKKNRGKMMGIFGASFGVGFILGPVIGGVCYQFGGANAIFYAGAVLGLLSAVAATCLPSCEAGMLKHKNGWLRATIENAEYLPKYGPSLIRRAVFFSFMIVLPLYAIDYLDLDTADVAYFFAASAIISVLLMPMTGKLVDKVRPEPVIALSLVLMAVLIAAFGFTDNVYVFSTLFLIESLCFAFMLPAGMKVFADAVDDQPQRTVIISAFGGLTEAITLVLAVLIPYLYSLSAQSAWVFIGVLCGLASLPFLKTKPLCESQAAAVKDDEL